MSNRQVIRVLISVAGSPPYNDKRLLPAAYAAEIIGEDFDERLIGYGWFRDTQVVFAFGISAALSEILLRFPEWEAADFPIIEIIAENVGFWLHLQHLVREIRGERRSTNPIDQREAWSELLIFQYLAKVQPPRCPIGTEREVVSVLKIRAKQQAVIARTKTAGENEGVLWEGSAASIEQTGT